MRRWTAATVVAVGMLCGYVGVLATHAGGTQADPVTRPDAKYEDWLNSLPEEKRVAIERARPATDLSPTAAAPAYESNFVDSGSARDVAIAKRETVRLMTAEGSLGIMPEHAKGRRALMMSPGAVAKRAEQSTEIWAPSIFAMYTAATERGTDAAVDDPAFIGYDAVQFVVDEWQGVSIAENAVHVQVLGHHRYHLYGQGWSDGRIQQHQLSLLWRDAQRDSLRIAGWAAVSRPGEPTGW